jgi:hypothetical protein
MIALNRPARIIDSSAPLMGCVSDVSQGLVKLEEVTKPAPSVRSTQAIVILGTRMWQGTCANDELRLCGDEFETVGFRNVLDDLSKLVDFV